MVTGPRNETEQRALSEGTDSAGGYIVPTPLASNFIGLLRARSHVFASGAQTIELPSETLSIAKMTTDPVPGWRSEAAALAESDPVLGQTIFTARSLGVLGYVEYFGCIGAGVIALQICRPIPPNLAVFNVRNIRRNHAPL
jgi:HK97 family phage major capsid protein